MAAKSAVSVAGAAVATVLAALAIVPVLSAIKPFWSGLLFVIVLAGVLHAAVGALVPRPAWAMAVPGPVLFAWFTVSLWSDITAPQLPGVEPRGGPGLLLVSGVGALGFGLALAGFIAAGAAWRQARDRRRPSPTGPPASP